MEIREQTIRVTRSARLVTTGTRVTPTEVWILLHGYGQLAEDFLQSCQALQAPGRLLAAPEGLSRFYLKDHHAVGASWMTRHRREAEIDEYVAYLDLVFQTVAAELDGPPPSLNVLGFSQGAATASRWAALGAHRPDRLVCWAGDVAHDISELSEVFRGVELTLVYGSRDRLVSPERQGEVHARLKAAGLPYHLRTFEGGHRMDDETLRGL